MAFFDQGANGARCEDYREMKIRPALPTLFVALQDLTR
jgi:hypothetical protein